jgi:hypothetical protein
MEQIQDGVDEEMGNDVDVDGVTRVNNLIHSPSTVIPEPKGEGTP